jgi:hypothetical protein
MTLTDVTHKRRHMSHANGVICTSNALTSHFFFSPSLVIFALDILLHRLLSTLHTTFILNLHLYRHLHLHLHLQLATANSHAHTQNRAIATSHSPLPLVTTSRSDIANPTNDESEHPQPTFPDLHQRSDYPTKSNTMASLKKTDDSQDHTLSTSLTVDNESSLSSSASVQKHQSFESTTAVLDTNELLHMIIAEVLLEYRPAIRVVSTIWKAAVTKVGYTIETSGYRKIGYSDSYDRAIPMVSSTATIDVNPAFPKEDAEFFNNKSDYEMRSVFLRRRQGQPPKRKVAFRRVGGRPGRAPEYYRARVPTDLETVGHEHEFIVNPPLTQVHMGVARVGLDPAILRVRGGIRVRDLVECSKKMLGISTFSHLPVWWSFGRESSGDSSGV